MATLVSPGVSVSVIDESISAGAGEGTVPFVLLVTAQDKTTPEGDSIASGTTKATAGQLNLVSSQRELLQLYGNPAFQSVGGTQLHGDPTNEYGLLAAYSYLGLANRCYVARADIDLDELQPTTIAPTSPKSHGTVWVDADDTSFGVFKWDANDDTWRPQEVRYVFGVSISSEDAELGVDGEHAVVFDGETITYYIKNTTWQSLELYNDGEQDYQVSDIWPTTKSDGSTTLVDGDHWVKTSVANNGVDFVLRVYNADVLQYELVESPVLASDAAANEYYNDDVDTSEFYIMYNSAASIFTVKRFDGTSWVAYDGYELSAVEPTDGPEHGVHWYNPTVGIHDCMPTIDVLVKQGSSWLNVRLPWLEYDPIGSDPDNESRGNYYDAGGGNASLYMQTSDPSLKFTPVEGDMWVDTDQLDEYPVIYKWKSSVSSWMLLDNTDQTTQNGILFMDARPDPEYTQAYTGSNNNTGGPDLDIDRPDPNAYPDGTILWNTRYSTRNVKQWDSMRLIGVNDNQSNVYTGRWVNASGNYNDGSPKMGETAQRAIIVSSMGSLLAASEDLRSDFVYFNVISAPGYPELIDEMVTLNVDRKETAFIIGDSPMNLDASSTSLLKWASNANNAEGNGVNGLVTADPYVGVYYPSGLSTNLSGDEVAVPASHMMLRQFGYNDNVAYPWFAPAGLQRGRISNSTTTGYVTSEGEFQAVALSQGQRDTLYTNNVNPIAVVPNQGIVAYGQKTRNPYDSALSRINVARLINYIRYNAERIAQPFLFELNDKQTRQNVKDVFDRFMAELVTLRGLYDFVVVVDDSNNTSARIDRNELWIDIAIQPVKVIEFIYIPIRIRATGADLTI